MSPLGNLSAVALLDRLQVLDRHRASFDAERLRVVDRYREVRSREHGVDERSVSAEIGLAVRCSSSHAESQVALAQSLTERLPDTFEAMHDGRIDLAKARALVELTQCLSAEGARVVEAKVLPKAAERTLTQVRAAVRYQRDRVDPAAAERCRQRAKAERGCSSNPSTTVRPNCAYAAPASECSSPGCCWMT